jgi:hypothetical protein
VVLRAVERDAEPLRDLFVRQALAQERQDLPLARREDIGMPWTAHLSHRTTNCDSFGAYLHYPKRGVSARWRRRRGRRRRLQ